jgi:hypothetical protein
LGDGSFVRVCSPPRLKIESCLVSRHNLLRLPAGFASLTDSVPDLGMSLY